jgi:hypothetical protein
MRITRLLPLPLALAAAVLAWAGLAFGCATQPAKPEAASAPAEAPAAASPATPQSAAPAKAELPELSFPYHRALKADFIVASLHEPELPKKAEAAVAAPKASVAEAASAGNGASSAAAKTEPSTAPKAAAEKPKAAAPAAKSAPVKPASPKPAAKPAAKDAAKDKAAAAAADPKNAPSTAALAATAVPEPELKPDIARNFTAIEGLRFEIPFGGTGWTYLGDKSQKEGIAYDSRRFEGTSLVFILNPTKAGDYILRFQRQDTLRGLSYEELVGVTVMPKASRDAAGAVSVGATPSGASVAAQASGQAPSSGTAQAANAALPASSAQTSASSQASVAASQANATTRAPANAASQTSAPSPAAANPNGVAASGTSGAAPVLATASTLATPEAALAQARSELEAGRPQGALEALDRLLVLSPAGTDEAYILYARALEANGPQKDIKRAYGYYKKLRDEYPESSFWDEAAARAAYIERHYFDIR